MPLYHRLLISTALLCLVAGTANGQAVVELSPEEAVRLGLERNLLIEGARADAAASRAAAREARAARLPAIRTRAEYTRLTSNIPEVDFTFPGIDTTFTLLPVELNRYHTEISVEQPIFTGFRVRDQIRTADHEARSSELTAEGQAVDIAFEIRHTYWSLYRAMAVREAMDASLARVEAHVRDVEFRVEEGTALMGELLAARTRRSEVRLERIEAENTVRVGRLELSRLIGVPLDSEIRPVAPADSDHPAAGRMPPTEQVAGIHPRIRAMEEQTSALRLQVNRARQEWLPEVALMGRYMYARPNPYFFAEQNQFRGTGEVGVLMRWNLFEGGRRAAQTARARAGLEAAEARLEDARQQVEVEVARQALEVQRAAEAVNVAAEHLEEAAEALRVIQQQYAEGLILSAQVLEAEQIYRMAEAGQAETLAAYAVAKAAVLRTLGRVW